MRSLSRVLLACLALALLPGSGKADDNPVRVVCEVPARTGPHQPATAASR